jgi:hypothetical protein
MDTKCYVCGQDGAIFLFCQDCLGKNRAETLDARIKVIIKLDKEKKMKSINGFLSKRMPKKPKGSIFKINSVRFK